MKLSPFFFFVAINSGSTFSTALIPILQMITNFPSSFRGLSRSTNAFKVAPFVEGPTFAAIGLDIPLKYSTCPPSSCLVLSPSHSK